MCGFQWKIWDRIIIYISVEKSRAQNSSKTHSRPQRLLFLAHLIWTWTCLYPRFHMMQHTSRLPCEPLVSLLYHQRLSGCYRPNGILQKHQLCTWIKIATELAAPLGLNNWLLGANPSLGHLRMSWARGEDTVLENFHSVNEVPLKEKQKTY